VNHTRPARASVMGPDPSAEQISVELVSSAEAVQLALSGAIVNAQHVGLILTFLHRIVILVVLCSAGAMAVPHGTSPASFSAISLAPVMAYMYPSRWMMLSVIKNNPPLGSPVLKVIDTLVARAVVEALASWVMAPTLLAVLAGFASGLAPRSDASSFWAEIRATISACSSRGSDERLDPACDRPSHDQRVIAAVWPRSPTGSALQIIVVSLKSGVLFDAERLP
jgi:hypothetical protein